VASVSAARGACATTLIAADADWHFHVRDRVERFLSDRGSRTRAAYAGDLNDFACFRSRSSAEAIADLLARSHATATQVALAYAVHLRRQGRATATVNRRLATLRAVARSAHDAGLVGWRLELPSDDAIAHSMGIGGFAEETPYLFPRHETEIDRLDVQHYALRQGLNGNYGAPVQRPARVLDVGSGTGQWAFDLSEEFPDSLVVGFDLAPTKAGRPANFAFVQGNLLQGLPFGADTFDFVHQRLMAASGVPLKSWSAVVTDLVRVTRPHGWLELVEAPPEIELAGPATERLFSMVRQLGRSMGLDTSAIIVRSLRPHLERAGLVDVQTLSVALPIGDSGGQVGSLLALSVRSGMTRLIDRFEERLGVPEVECRELIAAMTEEWDRYRSQSRFEIAFGRKPVGSGPRRVNS
jgi:SAM-dependent methyltransferase